MCLDRKMSKAKEVEFAGQKEGYKVFVFMGQILKGEWRATNRARPIGEWLKEGEYRDISFGIIPFEKRSGSYKTGWHIWLTLEGAKKWKMDAKSLVIRKVKFREPIVYGRQINYPVVVAKEMMILKEAS